MQATGVHDHASMKLGLKEAKPTLPRLKLADFLTGTIPDYPKDVDYGSGLTFGMYSNNNFGVCGPTGVCNYRRLITARLTGTMKAPTQEDCFALYRQSGNPRFNPNLPPNDPRQQDDGVVLQEMLDACMKYGVGGVKPIGHASVDVSNLDELDAAQAIFGGLLLGVDLQQAQQSQQTRWDYSPSRRWGGHCVLDLGQKPGLHRIITWANEIEMTDAFALHQEKEAWVQLWPEHLTDKRFLEAVDIWAFASAFQALTGKPFPAPLPPRPTPPTPPSTDRISVLVDTGSGKYSGYLSKV